MHGERNAFEMGDLRVEIPATSGEIGGMDDG
jgi:hypothetical protein